MGLKNIVEKSKIPLSRLTTGVAFLSWIGIQLLTNSCSSSTAKNPENSTLKWGEKGKIIDVSDSDISDTGVGLDYAYCVQQFFDNKGKPSGYLVFGETEGDQDLGDQGLVLKLDNYGNLEWEELVGDRGDDKFNYGIQSFDNQGKPDGILAAGKERGSWICKFDNNGNKLWENTYGNGAAKTILQDSDSNYVMSISLRGEDGYKLIKINQEGKLLKEWKTKKSDFDLGGGALTFTSDGGYAITGWSGVGERVHLIKLDKDFNEVIKDEYYLERTSRGYAVQDNGEGGVVIAGERVIYDERIKNARTTGLLIEIDRHGKMLWTKEFDGVFSSIQKIKDSQGNHTGYVLSGHIDDLKDKYNFWFVGVDKQGNSFASTTYKGSKGDAAEFAQQTFDDSGQPNGFILTGNTRSYTEKGDRSDIRVLKVDNQGNAK